MSQGYAIELYFDPALENQVLKAWNVLARRQISTQLIEIESRPHITLFSTPIVEPTKLESIIRNFASKQEPLPLSFSTIGGFCNDNNSLFLAPTPSIALLQFQSMLCEAIKKEGIELGEDYRPENWIPYCAVAQEVPKSRMAEAFCVLRELKLPVSGYGMDIGLVEYSPARELFSFVLGNSVEAWVFLSIVGWWWYIWCCWILWFLVFYKLLMMVHYVLHYIKWKLGELQNISSSYSLSFTLCLYFKF